MRYGANIGKPYYDQTKKVKPVPPAPAPKPDPKPEPPKNIPVVPVVKPEEKK